MKGGKKLKIHSTQALAGSDKNEPPGTVVKLDKDFLVVQCGQGQLKVLELQPESKPKMPTSQYLLGNSLQLGDVFGK